MAERIPESEKAPSGSSTYECGVSEWGGNWGDSIQQFKINRTLVSEN